VKTVKERRRHQRFAATDSILAVHSSNFGQVVNVSMGGLRLKYLLHRNDSFQNSFEIGLLSHDGLRYIDRLPCKVVSARDSPLSQATLDLFVLEVGVVFTHLSPRQTRQLHDFILHNSLAIA
jgi:hypothetical protein